MRCPVKLSCSLSVVAIGQLLRVELVKFTRYFSLALTPSQSAFLFFAFQTIHTIHLGMFAGGDRSVQTSAPLVREAVTIGVEVGSPETQLGPVTVVVRTV